LRVERKQGYAVASDEIEAGLTSVSVPVRNGQGHLLAVLNISGPTPRMIDRVEGTAGLPISASAAITKALGQRHTQDHEGAHRSRPLISPPGAPAFAVGAESRMTESADALMALT